MRAPWQVGKLSHYSQVLLLPLGTLPMRERVPSVRPVRAQHPNQCSGHLSQCLNPRHIELGVPFLVAKAQVIYASLEEVVARERNDNIDLCWNNCLLSWALKEGAQIPSR